MKNKDAIALLKEFDSIFPLDDAIYLVRDSEGLGWDGPDVKRWAAACAKLHQLLGDSNE